MSLNRLCALSGAEKGTRIVLSAYVSVLDSIYASMSNFKGKIGNMENGLSI